MVFLPCSAFYAAGRDCINRAGFPTDPAYRMHPAEAEPPSRHSIVCFPTARIAGMIDESLIRNAGVGLAVFCVWMASGVVNRRERWVFKSTVTAAILVILYVVLAIAAFFIDKYVVTLGP
jgi:hypothetical protein